MTAPHSPLGGGAAQTTTRFGDEPVVKKNGTRNDPTAQRNRLADAPYWETLTKELKDLVKEDSAATHPDEWLGNVNNPDDWLGAYRGPETDWKQQLPEFSPRRFVYHLRGGLDETLRERFKTIAIKIGVGLGAKPGTEFDHCLDYIFRDARKSGSKLLQMKGRGGGFIPRIAVAALNTCLRLEQQAMERQAAEQQAAEASKRTKKPPGRRPTALTQVIREMLNKQPELAAKEVCRLIAARFGADPKKYPTLCNPVFKGKTYSSLPAAYDPQAAPLIDRLISRLRPKNSRLPISTIMN